MKMTTNVTTTPFATVRQNVLIPEARIFVCAKMGTQEMEHIALISMNVTVSKDHVALLMHV